MIGSKHLFDRWPDPYEAWFRTPIGRLVLRTESAAVMALVEPAAGEHILDAGCGTGLFTRQFIEAGARVTGLDIATPMIIRARQQLGTRDFDPTTGSMTALPFPDATFEKTVSITAIEFISDGTTAVSELFRVTRPGGAVIVATLNRLSPWADRRAAAAAADSESLFRHTVFRSPEELAALAPVSGRLITAVHFQKDDPPDRAAQIESEENRKMRMTGAFVAAAWRRPDR